VTFYWLLPKCLLFLLQQTAVLNGHTKLCAGPIFGTFAKVCWQNTSNGIIKPLLNAKCQDPRLNSVGGMSLQNVLHALIRVVSTALPIFTYCWRSWTKTCRTAHPTILSIALDVQNATRSMGISNTWFLVNHWMSPTIVVANSTSIWVENSLRGC